MQIQNAKCLPSFDESNVDDSGVVYILGVALGSLDYGMQSGVKLIARITYARMCVREKIFAIERTHLYIFLYIIGT